MSSGIEQTKSFYAHLNHVVFERTHEKLLRENFRKSVESFPFTDTHLDILREHASPTGVDCIAEDYHRLWHVFSDAIKKGLMYLHVKSADEIIEGLKEITVFTQWNIANYSMMWGMDLSAETAPYPAASSDINTFPELLSYLQNSFLPAVKSHLANEQGITLEELDAELDAKGNTLIENGLVGIEIIRPIDRERWASIPRPL